MKASDWISVETGLPETTLWVPIRERFYSEKIIFFSSKGFLYVGQYSKSKGKKEDACFVCDRLVHLDITHWMPIVPPEKA